MDRCRDLRVIHCLRTVSGVSMLKSNGTAKAGMLAANGFRPGVVSAQVHLIPGLSNISLHIKWGKELENKIV